MSTTTICLALSRQISKTCLPFLRNYVLGSPGDWRMLAAGANGSSQIPVLVILSKRGWIRNKCGHSTASAGSAVTARGRSLTLRS